jgi:hypothetical protein
MERKKRCRPETGKEKRHPGIQGKETQESWNILDDRQITLSCPGKMMLDKNQINAALR